jgi:hypothetical protein
MKKIEEYFELIYPDRRNKLIEFHNVYLHLFNVSRGSNINHQYWEGGYRDHLEQFLFIAEHLFKINFDFNFDSVFMVCYFHDIEKLWKYSTGLNLTFDKDNYLKYQLPKHGIILTNEELNAIKYIHGENEDYGKVIMTSLGAFCHACDILSARSFSHKKEVTFRYC